MIAAGAAYGAGKLIARGYAQVRVAGKWRHRRETDARDLLWELGLQAKDVQKVVLGRSLHTTACTCNEHVDVPQLRHGTTKSRRTCMAKTVPETSSASE